MEDHLPAPGEQPQPQEVLPPEGIPGAGGTSTGTKKGSGESERDDFSGAEIPSYVIDAAGFRSRFDDGGIYPEIDSYVLYGVDKQMGIPVPGTEVCVEGDQLHTKERTTITEVKTDHSKCRVVELGDRVPLKEICPPEAHTRIVHINHYASSPLVYSGKDLPRVRPVSLLRCGVWR